MIRILLTLVIFFAPEIYSAPSNQGKTINTWVYYEFLRIEEKEAQKRFAEVEEDYLELIYESTWSSRSFDHAVILKRYGFFLIRQDRAEEGLEFIEWALRKRALEDRDVHNLQYVVGQINASLGNYELALDKLMKWYQVGQARNYDLTPKGIALIGICHAQLEEYKEGLKYITIAIDKANIFIKSWYELKFALHYRLDDFDGALSTSQDLVANFPRDKKYLEQMGAMYNELDFDIQSLSSLEFGLTQRVLEKERDYLLLSNFFMFKDVPIEAAKVLDEGLRNGIIERNEDNLESLANALIGSREYIKAADILSEASKLSSNPDLPYRLGQIELNLSRWAKAVESFKLAEKYGWDDEEGQIDYFIGICFIELQEYDDAVSYLSKAAEAGKEDSVAPWLEYIQYLKDTAG